MAKMNVTYYDCDGAEMEVAVHADDEAAALGVVLDTLGDEIQAGSPFAVWRETEPRRATAGARKPNAKARVAGKPHPTGECLYEEDDEDDDESEETEARELTTVLGRTVLPLPDAAQGKTVTELFAGLKESLGVEVQR